ncbi:hypothetical protein [Pectobacterium brasiliense]|uniref:hypothetical protein n=1 Tax=Pectobacterium brasiliense TaxID=180957 RepID=UPI003BB13B89
MTNLANEAIKSRIEALKNTHAQNKNAIASTHLADAKALEELLSLRAQLANLPADWSKDSSLETWFPLSAEHIARLEAQLAELRGQATLKKFRDVDIHDLLAGVVSLMIDKGAYDGKSDYDKLVERARYVLRNFARPVPPAASQHVPGEPDYWVYDTKFGLDISREKPEHEENTEPYFPVFKAVPVASQPYTVPDKMPPDVLALIKSSVDELFDGHDAQEIWSACRAAILQHQPQSSQQNIPENIPAGNSPVVPDGWVTAPDLLEALEKIIEMNVRYAHGKYGDERKADDMACVKVARLAIAKAKGES